MDAVDIEELQDTISEIDSVFRCHRDFLNRNERIRNPLHEAFLAAQTKLEDARSLS